jgi:alcohol dehydrogenase (NADP+)
MELRRGIAGHRTRGEFDLCQRRNTISRREPRPDDVDIEILYCRLCHTDIHTAHGEWDGLIYPNGTIYPCVPGHEIVGRMTSVGPDAKRFKVGEVVAVGTMVDSCLECAAG